MEGLAWANSFAFRPRLEESSFAGTGAMKSSWRASGRFQMVAGRLTLRFVLAIHGFS